MRKITLLLAYVASISCGQHAQISSNRLEGGLTAEGMVDLKMVHPSRTLAMLLLSCGSRAAFKLCGPQVQLSQSKPVQHGSQIVALDTHSRLGHSAPVMGPLEDLKVGEFLKDSWKALDDKRVQAMIDNGVLDEQELDTMFYEPDRQMPVTFEDSIEEICESVQEALVDFKTRLIIEYDQDPTDDMYPIFARTFRVLEAMLGPLSDALAPLEPGIGPDATTDADGQPLPTRIQVLFPDQGTASNVQQNWDLPNRTVLGSFKRVRLAEGTQALIVVAPVAADIDDLNQIIDQVDEQSPETIVVLINPQIVAKETTGLSGIARDMRAKIGAMFEISYSMRYWPQAGAVHRVYPGPWVVWRENREAFDNEGRFTATYSNPVPPDMMDVIMKYFLPDGETREEGFFEGISSFFSALRAL